MTPQNRKRLGFILIVLFFASPIIVAYVLNAAGWRPAGTRNYGTMVDPAQDFSSVRLVGADGQPLPLKDAEFRWTLLALPGPSCASACLAKLDELRRARLTLNQNASRVRVVVVDGSLEASAVAPLQPLVLARDPDARFATLHASGADQVSAALVDPNGFLVLTYAAGYDGNGLRKDLARLLK